MRKIVLFVLVLLGLLSTAAPALACEPPPTDYLDCTEIGWGYKFGFLIPGSMNYEYQFRPENGDLIGGAPTDIVNYVTIYNSNGRSFSWKSTMGIDAVIINAGGKSVVKKLTEVKSGTNYYGVKDYTGRPARIQNIVFCYDYELTATASGKGKTTGTSTTWDITKTVDVAEQAKFAGEAATFNYTVAVKAATGGETGATVTSEVKVKNPTPFKAKITSVKAILAPWNIEAKLNCKVSFPYYLAAKNELTCTATTPVPNKQDGEVQAKVSTYGFVAGANATGKIVWSTTTGGTTAGSVAGPVTVTDTNAAFGGPYTVSADKTWTYPVALSCPADPSLYTNGEYVVTLDNTAAITEAAKQASQSVKLHCYIPTVTATSGGTYDAFYAWDITKTSPTAKVTVAQGESANVNYTVGVSVANKLENNFQIAGAVTVANPNPAAAMQVSLVDEIAAGVPANLTDCTNPVTVPAGQSVTCHYTYAAAGKPAGTNTAKVTFNGMEFVATAPYTFTVANETDECVTVTDSALPGTLGVACANQSPATYNYTLALPAQSECGSTTFVNTAKYTTNDTLTNKLANWTVEIFVDCGFRDCTFNANYWRNHANPGDPLNYNANWDKLGELGPQTPFFAYGNTWIGILSEDGNTAYKALADQYISMYLNILYGTTIPDETLGLFSEAGDLLTAYSAAPTSMDAATQARFEALTGWLTSFNEGFTGPGLCPACLQ